MTTMEEEYFTPDSTLVYVNSAVDLILEEALEKSLPAHYISTLMPSRQLYRSGIGINTSDQTCQMARKRTSSMMVRKRQTSADTESDLIDSRLEVCDQFKSTNFNENVELLQEMVRFQQKPEGNFEDSIPLKLWPIAMNRKREIRDSLSKHKIRVDNRYIEDDWKMRMSKNYTTFRESVGSAFSNIHYWKNSIHKIEGQYGTAVAAVFYFIQWLMAINFLIMLLVISFIVIPNAVMSKKAGLDDTVLKTQPAATLTCNFTESTNEEDSRFGPIQDLLQGTGWMEWTSMFYGFYFFNFTNATDWDSPIAQTYATTEELAYNLPLAYILITVVYFSFCLILILKSAAKDSREILFSASVKLNEGCNLVFCGWDYCINEGKKALIRNELIYNEIMKIAAEERLLKERLQRTKRQNVKIILIRILINIIVLIILATCGYLIFAVVTGSQEALNDYQNSDINTFVIFLIEFLPSLTITVLNLVIPVIFEKLVQFENYSPASVTNMTLGRTVILKLAGILVLLASLYKSISNSNSCTYHCWETYVGQQIYKLTIMDFMSIVFITFFIQFPRKLIMKNLHWPFITWIGQQPFDIPSQVLDIVYSQTLCWMGTFYSPLLSVVNVIKFFILFYMKKFSLFVNCAPARLTYQASKSNKLFMMVLLLSYVIAILPVFYSIVNITPSIDCGPFIGYDSMWGIVPETMENWPTIIRNFFHFFATLAFVVPAIVGLSLFIYYYITIASAHSREKELMQDQLLVEGQDKQYLLKMLHQVMEELSNIN